MNSYTQDLLTFIKQSPSCFHAVDNIKKELTKQGFTQLFEGSQWDVKPGGNYFVTRNLSSIIAFKVPQNNMTSFQIVASHSDSPTFKVKENAEIEVKKHYIQLNTERYGGMICTSWFDRPLSIAGRIVVKQDGKIKTHLIDMDRDLVLIPNLAIHMNRQVNDGYTYNAQVDMVPLYGDGSAKDTFMGLIAQQAEVCKDDILGTDLFLYNRMEGTVWGADNEFISSPKLDDLECAFTSMKAFLDAPCSNAANVYCVFDNEEVGSGTKQGAASTFLYDVLERMNDCLGKSKEDYRATISSSFMLSADNAHALHPNHPAVSDPTNPVYMNEGIVIKYNANQKYTTDGVSAAIFKQICDSANVAYQTFANRSDILGGSTLGNISNAQVSLNTIDIGLAQLAMHSSYETAGVRDIKFMIDGIKAFYSAAIHADCDGDYTVTL